MEPFTDDKLDPFYHAIGYFTVNWAHLEFALDCSVRIFHQWCGGRDAINAELPLSLENKLTFFKKSLRTLPVLAPFREKGVELAGKVGALKRDRHDSIHGVLMDFEGTEEYARTIWNRRLDEPPFRDHKVTLTQIREWGLETGELAVDLLAFTRSVYDQIVRPKYPREGS